MIKDIDNFNTVKCMLHRIFFIYRRNTKQKDERNGYNYGKQYTS